MSAVPQERSPSLLQELFAERQVYVRSGSISRYVGLSRAMQIGATLGFAALLGLLGLASYGALAKHFETLAQQQELSRLEGVNQSLRIAAENAQASTEWRLAAEKVPKLTSELAEVTAARDRALKLAEASAAEAETLRSEIDLAEERVAELTLQLQQAHEEIRTLNQRLAELQAADPEHAADAGSGSSTQSADAVASR